MLATGAAAGCVPPGTKTYCASWMSSAVAIAFAEVRDRGYLNAIA
jgi:hypothetical protein